MATVRVESSRADGSELEIGLRLGRRTHRIHLRCANTPLVPVADVGLILALLPAMIEAEELTVECAVSARLAAALPRIQRFLCGARPRMREIRVRADVRPAHAPNGRGSAAFFSGGADSMHTAVTQAERLDALVFVHGFDIALHRTGQRRVVSARLREAAAALGKPLVEVETDARSFTDGYVGWVLFHGAFMAATAHALGGRYREFLCPPTDPPSGGKGFGSHRDLDFLWSTEAVEIEHDAAGTLRIERLAGLVRHPVFNAHLRICYKAADDEWNCGRCQKCRRTRMYLRALGAQGLCKTLPPRIEIDEIDALEAVQTNADAAERALPYVHARGDDPELEAALLRLRDRWRARAAPGDGNPDHGRRDAATRECVLRSRR